MISFDVFHYICLPFKTHSLQFSPKEILFSIVEAARNGTKPIPHPLQHLAMAELL